MKDNINKVFALKSYRGKPQGDFEHDGFLMFPDEAYADRFIGLCEHTPTRGPQSRYEKLDWAYVGDFIGDRVQTNKSCFVREMVGYDVGVIEAAKAQHLTNIEGSPEVTEIPPKPIAL